jgi:uncharacterized damage-inducible protein DinB
VWPTPPFEAFDYYVNLQDQVRSRTLECVRQFGDPAEVKEAEWGTMTLRWVLAHVIWHDAYHGGQAVLLKELQARLGG